MIKHILFFRLKAYSLDDKNAILDEMERRFLELSSKIHEIKFLEVGKNFNKRDVAFDICLYTHFENRLSLDAYQIHPAHKELLNYLNTINREIAVVDYEI